MERFERAATLLEYDKVLSAIAECCVLDAGAAKIMKTRPLTDFDKIVKLQHQTSEAKRLLGVKGMPSLSAPSVIPDAVKRADKGAILSTGELLAVASLLSSASSVKNYGEANECDSSLSVLFSRMLPSKPLESSIKKIIVGEDQIADDASDELFSIRRRIRTAESRVRETLQKYISGAFSQCLQENIITLRNGRYVVPVKVEHKNEIKGMIHDTSSSGATVFVEPAAIVDLNNEIKILEGDEKTEIERILRTLSSEVAAISDAIKLNFANIVAISMVFARAEYSFRIDAAEPKLVQEPGFSFVRARHPLIDKKRVVPVNISLGKDYDTLVITGPNTGGKTVTLKTAGLLVMMAQSGIHIPCDETSYTGVFGDVLADIGDEQSIEQSLSTFSSHMVKIIEIIEGSGSDSLVLFDELGAGTDPIEGAALAIAILETVRERGAKCLATTHYAELKTYALDTDRVENASCEFDVATLKPTYRLIIGTPGRSNAFLISKRLGLSESIIERAGKLIDSSNRDFERVVEKLEADRIEMEKSKEEAIRASRETVAMQEKALAEREKLIAEAQKELERAKREANRLVMSARQVSDETFNRLEEFRKKTAKELLTEDLKNERANLRQKLKSVENEIDEKILPDTHDDYELPRELKVGDSVLIPRTGKDGTVEKINGKDVTVLSGSIRMRMNIKELRLVTDLKKVGKKKTGSTTYSARPQVSPEIDLRGQTGDDAWFMVDKYLDSARLAGLNVVTLIHGKGTGALRAALWRYLKRDKRIKNMRMGQYGEGDFGVTVVELK